MPRLSLVSVEDDPVAMETHCRDCISCSVSGMCGGEPSRKVSRSSWEMSGCIPPGGKARLAVCCVGMPRFIKTCRRKFALEVIYQKEACDGALGSVKGPCQNPPATGGSCQKYVASDCLGYVELSVEEVLGGSLGADMMLTDTSGEGQDLVDWLAGWLAGWLAQFQGVQYCYNIPQQISYISGCNFF